MRRQHEMTCTRFALYAVHVLQVLTVGPEEVAAGDWREDCLLLVMPGGADLPYCRQLNGPGTASIRGKHAILLLSGAKDPSRTKQMSFLNRIRGGRRRLPWALRRSLLCE